MSQKPLDSNVNAVHRYICIVNWVYNLLSIKTADSIDCPNPLLYRHVQIEHKSFITVPPEMSYDQVTVYEF